MTTNTRDKSTATDLFYLANGELVTGPYAMDQVRGMWKTGSVYATTLICAEGSANWRQVSEMMADTPEPVNPAVYRVLCFFFGMMGIHNFVEGNAAAGIWKIALTVIGAWLFSAGSSGTVFGGTVLLFVAAWAFGELVKGPVPVAKVEKVEADEDGLNPRMTALILLLTLALIVMLIAIFS